MALSTRYASNLANREEKPSLKTGKASSLGRSALGNISNRANVAIGPNKVGGKKAEGKKGLIKSTATSSLQTIAEKENVTKINQICKESERDVPAPPSPPGPMDISANNLSMSDAFSSKNLQLVQDIDKEDGDNPLLVSEYVQDIYNYLRVLEAKYEVKDKYLTGQDVSGRMRAILVDWLVQVHLRFHLLQETLYLTVAIIDRYMQVQKTARAKLQLVGVTAMLVASKYEEMYAPEIADFVYITDNAYTKADIRKMENEILRTLDFSLGRPLPLHFLRRNSKAGEVDATTHTVAKYLMELSITDYDSASLMPSLLAAAALCLAMKVMGMNSWTDTLTYYSNYSEAMLEEPVRHLASLVAKAGQGKLTAVYAKYQSSKFMRVSALPQLKSPSILSLAGCLQ